MSHDNINFQQALAVATATLKNRKTKDNAGYVLYYAHNPYKFEGKISGRTIQQVFTEFKQHGKAYRYALVYRQGSDKVLRVFNRDVDKLLHDPNRIGKSRKKK